VAGPAIVELARAAVRRLADAGSVAAGAAGAVGGVDAQGALERIERVGLGPPYTVVLAGDLVARTELLNWLVGAPVFDAARRDPVRIVMQLRRGPATALRVRRRDGSVTEHVLDAAPAAGTDAAGDADPARPRGRRARRHDDRARTVPAADLPAFRDAVVLSAEAETTAMVRRPPWWAVWRWLLLGWRALWSRRAPSPDAAAPRGADAPDTASAPVRRGFANTVARERRTADSPEDFAAALGAALADPAVEKLFVEVGRGPLPDKVVLIELPSGAEAWPLDAVAADACLVACGARGFAMTEQLVSVLDIVPHVFAVGGEPRGQRDPRVRRLDSAASAMSSLIELATLERALAVGQRAAVALAAGSAALDAAITRAEIGFRARLDRLESMRVASPDDHVAAALSRIRPDVVEHVQQLLRRALDGLDAEITALGATWSTQLADAGATDALRAAAAQIDEASPAALGAAQVAAHTALVDGLTACARHQYDALIGALRRGTTRDDAAPPWLTAEVAIAELTSSTSLGAVAPRLTSLFRSRDALRTEAVAQLDQRIARLRQVAAANLLDTEPRLEPAVTGTLAIGLRGEVLRHVAWLEAELDRERVAIDAERAQLAVLAIARDTAQSDERELVTALEALAADLP
jgi:hypothetical protein